MKSTDLTFHGEHRGTHLVRYQRITAKLRRENARLVALLAPRVARNVALRTTGFEDAMRRLLAGEPNVPLMNGTGATATLCPPTAAAVVRPTPKRRAGRGGKDRPMPTKQTTDRLSSDAARVLEALKGHRAEVVFTSRDPDSHIGLVRQDWTKLVKSLAASVLGQDETRGTRRRSKAKAKAR